MSESQDTLDIDDVVAGHPVAEQELRELREKAERASGFQRQLMDEREESRRLDEDFCQSEQDLARAELKLRELRELIK